jgi:hypothetical protein
MKTRFVLLAALCAASSATAQFDVNYSPSPYTVSSGFDGTGFVKAQSFTVGASGYLTRVDLLMRGASYSIPVYWDLRAMNGAVPVSANSAALASGSMDSLSLPSTATFYTFDLSSFAISVTPGQVLTFVLRGAEGNGNNAGSLFGTEGNAFAGGRGFIGSLSGGNVSWRTDYDYLDYGIRTVVVPEPATAGLVAALAVLAGVALLRRRRA